MPQETLTKSAQSGTRVLHPLLYPAVPAVITIIDMAVGSKRPPVMLWTCATERMIFFNNEATRIPTQIVTMNDHFSEAVLKNGCTVEFDSGSA